MRMINADDLEQALREAGLMEVIKDDCSKCTSAWGVPIVDAEEVVRCKDCKCYWKNHPHPTPDVPVCLASPKDDAFCSEGEKR